MSVALVLVSHADEAARGTARIAVQMAPDVAVVPVGGTPDGGLGTDLDRLLEVLDDVLRAHDGAVVIGDLGSAQLTAESAVELLDDDDASRVRVVTAPFVEGAVAASVAAQQGDGLDAVARTAVSAGRLFAAAADDTRQTGEEAAAPATDTDGGSGADVVRAMVVLRDPHGLHARPAAVLARLATGLPARVLVGGVDAASMLELMRLDAHEGVELTVESSGPGAKESVDAVVAAIDEGLGEADR